MGCALIKLRAMSFHDLQKGHQVYVVDRSKEVSMMQGTVTAKGQPYLPQMQQPYGGIGSMSVDVTVELCGRCTTYTVPDNADIAYTQNDVVVTPNKEMALREVESVRNRAQERLDCHDADVKIVSMCDDILSEWRPEVKEKRETEERFGRMEKQIGELTGLIREMMNKK
jgi:hypothetical protein